MTFVCRYLSYRVTQSGSILEGLAAGTGGLSSGLRAARLSGSTLRVAMLWSLVCLLVPTTRS